MLFLHPGRSSHRGSIALSTPIQEHLDRDPTSPTISKISKPTKPVLIMRYLGTTPDSSAITPMLISLCQQVSINVNSRTIFSLTNLIPFRYLITTWFLLTLFRMTWCH